MVLMGDWCNASNGETRSLAHEIRNPLNALNLNVTLIERRLRASTGDISTIEPSLEVMRSEIKTPDEQLEEVEELVLRAVDYGRRSA